MSISDINHNEAQTIYKTIQDQPAVINAKCSLGSGWFSAKMIKIFSKDDNAVAAKLCTKLKEGTLTAETLRWFTPHQLEILATKLKDTKEHLTTAPEVFQKAIGLAVNKHHSVSKFTALLLAYGALSTEEKTTEIGHTTITQPDGTNTRQQRRSIKNISEKESPDQEGPVSVQQLRKKLETTLPMGFQQKHTAPKKKPQERPMVHTEPQTPIPQIEVRPGEVPPPPPSEGFATFKPGWKTTTSAPKAHEAAPKTYTPPQDTKQNPAIATQVAAIAAGRQANQKNASWQDQKPSERISPSPILVTSGKTTNTALNKVELETYLRKTFPSKNDNKAPDLAEIKKLSSMINNASNWKELFKTCPIHLRDMIESCV